MTRCPECGHDPEPLRRARANYERRRKDRRAAAKKRKRESDAELAKLGILPTKPTIAPPPATE